MNFGLTGRIAAGKGVLADYLRDKNYSYYSISSIIRAEATRRGIPITREHLQDLGNNFREKVGAAIWVDKIVAEIKEDRFIIDGIRNPAEIDYLRSHVSSITIIGVDADQLLRYNRVLSRNKSSDPKTWEAFLEIDNRDYGIGELVWGQQVQLCLERADYILQNNGNFHDFYTALELLLNQ